MKRYIANKPLYFIFPIFILSIILSYMLVLYKKSYTYVNYINIGLDIALLVIYINRFCTEVSIDSKGINFRGLIFKRRVYKEDFKRIIQADFLTKIVTKSGDFYILTTKNGREVLNTMFKDIGQGE